MNTNEFSKGMNFIILEYCRIHDLTQVEFANEADINVAQMCRQLRRGKDIYLRTFVKCMRTMKVDEKKVLEYIRKLAIDDQPQNKKPSPPKPKRKRNRLPKS